MGLGGIQLSNKSLRKGQLLEGCKATLLSQAVVAVVQLLSCVRLFGTPWTAARQASLSFTISWSLLRLVSIESIMPSNYLILCNPLLLLPSVLGVIIKTKAVKLMTVPKRNFFQGRKWTALGHILRVTDIEGVGLGIGALSQR